MLMSIRDRATGVFAWVIVILLIIPFALWGIQEYFGGGSAINVAIVNDLEISRNDLNQRVDSELRGQKQRPEGDELVSYRRQVLERMIQEEILFQAAIDNGFRIHEGVIVQTIRNNNAFHEDGQFNQQRYEDILRYNGMSPQMYQNSLSRDMVVKQFVGSVQASNFVTKAEVDTLLRLQNRKLDLELMTVSFKSYRDQVKVSDEDVKKYYDERQQNFMTAAMVKLDYLILNPQIIESELKYTDKQLQAFYEDNLDSFVTPEQRQLAHIQIDVAEGNKPDDVAKAKKLADEVYAKLQQGADFAEMAKQHSQDAGSAAQGGDIGILEEGSLDKAFEAAALKLKKGEYSQPVKTEYGFNIIKLLDTKPGTNKAFDEVRADVEKMKRKRDAEELFLDRKETLYNKTFENPESLEIAAEALGLKVRSTNWFSRSGKPEDAVAYDPKIVEAAFSGDVFAGGKPERSLNSKLLTLKPRGKKETNEVVVIRLADYKPSEEQKLEQVQDEIRKTLTNKQASEAMDKALQSYVDKLKAGGKLDALAKELSLEYKATGFVGRVDPKQDSLVLSAAFKTPTPAEGKSSYTTVRNRQGDGVVVVVKAAKQGEVKKQDPSRRFMSQFMQRLMSNDELAAFVDSLKAEADITIFEERLKTDDES